MRILYWLLSSFLIHSSFSTNKVALVLQAKTRQDLFFRIRSVLRGGGFSDQVQLYSLPPLMRNLCGMVDEVGEIKTESSYRD